MTTLRDDKEFACPPAVDASAAAATESGEGGSVKQLDEKFDGIFRIPVVTPIDFRKRPPWEEEEVTERAACGGTEIEEVDEVVEGITTVGEIGESVPFAEFSKKLAAGGITVTPVKTDLRKRVKREVDMLEGEDFRFLGGFHNL